MCESCKNSNCFIKQSLQKEEIDLDLLLEKLLELERRPLRLEEEFKKKMQYLNINKEK
jgi:hypothetical protein